MFVVEARYETRKRTGKEFVNWFVVEEFDNYEDAKEYAKSCKSKIKPIDKATKLKHEYQIIEK